MAIRKGFQSNSRTSQFCSAGRLAQAGEVVVADIVRVLPDAGGARGAARPLRQRRKMRRARRSASRIAASGVDWPEATAAHICTITYSALAWPEASLIGPL